MAYCDAAWSPGISIESAERVRARDDRTDKILWTAPMSKPHAMVLILTMSATALIAGGCGQLAYKTGAGVSALEADELACKQGVVSDAIYAQCIHDKGWSIANLDGSGATPVAATRPPLSPSGTPGSADQAPAVAATAAVVPPVDPKTPVKVTTWIRFGGGGPGDDIAACVATLGPASQPDTVNKTVTRALLGCMREKGWRGL
jgi:hypothetical protein